jgi:hypothetical protein
VLREQQRAPLKNGGNAKPFNRHAASIIWNE